MSVSAPRIILPALKQHRKRTMTEQMRDQRERRGRDEKEFADDPLSRGLAPAIADMKTLVDHVAALLDGPLLENVGISGWLVELHQALDHVRASLLSGELAKLDTITIDDDAPSSLESALSRAPTVEDAGWPDLPEFLLLRTLVDYWVQQLKARGYSLLHLLIGADDLIEAAASFAHLEKVTYPL
jgi:hypothetical protein